jgi:hypothetical protein
LQTYVSYPPDAEDNLLALTVRTPPLTVSPVVNAVASPVPSLRVNVIVSPVALSARFWPLYDITGVIFKLVDAQLGEYVPPF